MECAQTGLTTGQNKRLQTGPATIQAETVSRDFTTGTDTVTVLRSISFQAAQGDMVALTGASGVGKSTLLHILGGLDRPTEGTVHINGINLNEQSDTSLAKFRREQLGFVFQFHYLLDDFSALENVMMPMLINEVDMKTARERGEQLLDRVGLAHRMKHRPKQLSGGEQQRAAVARALANKPAVVLADEPSGNLDTATGRMLHDLLFQLNTELKTTFVIATHNRELASRCTRELALVSGSLLSEGPHA